MKKETKTIKIILIFLASLILGSALSVFILRNFVPKTYAQETEPIVQAQPTKEELRDQLIQLILKKIEILTQQLNELIAKENAQKSLGTAATPQEEPFYEARKMGLLMIDGRWQMPPSSYVVSGGSANVKIFYRCTKSESRAGGRWEEQSCDNGNYLTPSFAGRTIIISKIDNDFNDYKGEYERIAVVVPEDGIIKIDIDKKTSDSINVEIYLDSFNDKNRIMSFFIKN